MAFNYKLQSGNDPRSQAQLQKGGTPGWQVDAGGTMAGLATQKLDPMGALAQLLGLNSTFTGSPNIVSDAYGNARESYERQSRPLQHVMNRMLGEDDANLGGFMKHFRSGSPATGGTYGGGRAPGGGASFGGSEPDDEGDYAVVDPYKQVREAAIKSALNYLKIQNPHSFSSLKRN